ncbi:COG1361 family protein [Aporhodopirellula aestuarii]
MAALLAAAVVTSSVGLGNASVASAQTFENSSQIQQVVGKQLSTTRRSGNSNYARAGGLLGNLFGGGSSSSSSSSSKSDEPYRHATPVPNDRNVDWSGIPYHDPNGGRTAASQPAPIRDPGASSRQLAQPQRTPASSADVARSTRTSVPTPQPITQTTPRKLSSTDTAQSTSSSRPAPLSASRSSRRPISVQPTTSEPTRIDANTPELVKSVTPRVLNTTPDNVELVPRVSRKIVKNTTPTLPAAPAKSETKTEAVPAKESVAKSESGSSRRASTPEAAPKKVETPEAKAPRVASREVAQVAPRVAATAPAPVAEKPAAEKPAAAPEQKPAIAASPAVVEEKVAKETVAATVPAAPAPVAPTAPAVPKTQISSITLGEARQANIASINPPASLGTPTTAADNSAGMSLPGETSVHSASSRPQAPSTQAAAAPQPQYNRMNTFGNNQDGGRSAGALASTNPNGVALHPISDRLPIEVENESPEAMRAQHDSQFMAHHDAFAPRNPTMTSPTTPNYRSAGFGQGSNSFGPPMATQSTVAQQHPNAMRNQLGTPAPTANAMTTPQTPAINVMPNSNMTEMELPVIRILTAGPRRVMIRQTHPYEIRVENRGSVDAEGLVVRAHIPDWADVVGQQVTRGDVQAATEEQIRNLDWRIETLPAGQSETMYVRLKAARSGTHDLDVDWTLAPQKKVVQVTVQEPQLALTIDGPDEVIYGQSKTYQIRVLNPGDGIAPAVVFTLSPESSSPQSQRIGDIPAGKEAQFEVELTAQDLGELKIHGLAVGDLELRAEAGKNVRVLAADLEAILSGPEAKYQGAEALYQLELTNHGTTASEDVIANLQLPMGVSYLGGMEGATMIDNQLRWKIASLSPGSVRKYQFQCRMDSTGTHQFAFDCKGSAAGQTNVSLDTNVEAIADLVLSVVDPSAPAPIGEDVSYQIVIRNRGSKPAFDVKAVAQFSHGIEPKQISGHVGKVITGQVLIDPISRIEPGQEVRMTIVARAETGGHHRFRTEVRSGDTVLVAEEATHYLAPQNERITRRSGPGGNEFSLPLR